MKWLAEVRVLLKPSVNDPQAQSIVGALHALGFPEVESARAGKTILLRMHADGQDAADQAVEAMCARLLANPVIEEYTFTLTALDDAPPPAAP